MYLRFAWRYLRAKKSANAINWIAWVTVGVIAFATCCQILVLSVFNGFEGLVKSLYHSFYADIRIEPNKGSFFQVDTTQLKRLNSLPGAVAVHPLVEEKGLLQHDSLQTVVQLKGVTANYLQQAQLDKHIYQGAIQLGSIDEPQVILGAGIQQALEARVEGAFEASVLTAVLPRFGSVNAADPMQSLSEGQLKTAGVFAIQQEFDNQYALVPIDWLRLMQGIDSSQCSAVEIRLSSATNPTTFRQEAKDKFPANWHWETRYEQNSTLYQTMQTEKWAIYAILTLILIIAAFNMISALTMLVLEKKKDISVLRSLGASSANIRRLFLTEGLLLGVIGSAAGFLLALIIAYLQLQFKLIRLEGGSFLVDHFPVSLQARDFLLVGGTALLITLIAAWIPANQAARQSLDRNLG